MRQQWFPRLADIPNVGYEGSSGVNRARLPGSGEKPTTQSYRDEKGGTHTYLVWPDGGSQSPAGRHADSTIKNSVALLKRLDETLELPGNASDYHFALQHVISQLWGRRRQEPEHLDRVESLCWLDIRLVQACPSEFWMDRAEGESRYFKITAFRTLRTMYEREGALREALEVEHLADEFDQPKDLELLEAKVAVLDSETAT